MKSDAERKPRAAASATPWTAATSGLVQSLERDDEAAKTLHVGGMSAAVRPLMRSISPPPLKCPPEPVRMIARTAGSASPCLHGLEDLLAQFGRHRMTTLRPVHHDPENFRAAAFRSGSDPWPSPVSRALDFPLVPLPEFAADLALQHLADRALRQVRPDLDRFRRLHAAELRLDRRRAARRMSRSAPGLSCTIALSASPHFSSGTPITAQSSTSERVRITRSISDG